MNIENIDFFVLSCFLFESGNHNDGKGDDAVAVWFVYDANQYCIQIVFMNDFSRMATERLFVSWDNMLQFKFIGWMCGIWANILSHGVSAMTIMSQCWDERILLPDGLEAVVVLANRDSAGKMDLAVIAHDDDIEEECLETALQKMKQRLSKVLPPKKSKKY